jgi:hypothetical protein
VAANDDDIADSHRKISIRNVTIPKKEMRNIANLWAAAAVGLPLL